jgi:predicted histone-like DNA-binding protein
MAIKFHAVQRKDPRDRTLPGKYYAEIVNRYEISFEQFLNEITDMSTVTVGDTYNVMQTSIHLLKKHLQEGRAVRLGDMGTFYLTVNSEGKDSIDDVDAKSIVQANIRYRPSVKLKEILNRLSFQKTLVNGTQANGG